MILHFLKFYNFELYASNLSLIYFYLVNRFLQKCFLLFQTFWYENDILNMTNPRQTLFHSISLTTCIDYVQSATVIDLQHFILLFCFYCRFAKQCERIGFLSTNRVRLYYTYFVKFYDNAHEAFYLKTPEILCTSALKIRSLRAQILLSYTCFVSLIIFIYKDFNLSTNSIIVCI